VRVKEVSLQGYKSFAAKQRFVFPTGITAIVGPNGSGKSNIADAIRWVLGEQRATTLRAKRLEELIFAGSQQRARLGLAEVSLTFDNADDWLAIEFPEVVVSRRIQRDGTSTYAVNGAPVRLRDLVDLLGPRLGQATYAVIGQGLVDSALSMRPDERRTLIDEAAGIVPLQRKRDRTLRQLAETDENLTRVRDILAEIGPRLRRMGHLADRAARFEAVSGTLQAHLGTWYGHHWRQASADVARHAAAIRDLEAQAEATRAAVRALEAAVHHAERQADEAGLALAAGHRERQTRAEAVAATRQAAAVAEARREAAAVRQREHAAAIAHLEAALAELGRRVHAHSAEIGELEARHQDEAGALEAERRALRQAELEQEARRQAREAARLAQRELVAAVATKQEQLDALAAAERARREQLAAGRRSHAELDQKEQAAAAEIRAAEAALETAEQRLVEVDDRLRELEQEARSIAADLAAAQDTVATAGAELAARRARAEALAALFAELEAGSMLARRRGAAAPRRTLGTVAELLEAEPAWAAAVAAAVGPWIRALVVGAQEAAEELLGLLQDEDGGAVTVVSLAAQAAVHRPWSAAAGEVGVAAVARTPRAPSLAAALCGDVAFVEDLAAARRALARPDGPTRSATRDGLLLARGEVLSAGIGRPAQELLALEAERRELPRIVAALEEELAAAQAEARRLAADRGALEERRQALLAERAAAGRTRQSAEEPLQAARATEVHVRREREWLAASVTRLGQEAAQLARDQQQLQAELERRAAAAAAAEVELAAGDGAAAADPAADRQALAGRAAAVQELAQRLAVAHAMLDAAQRELRAAELRLAAARAEADGLAAEIASLGAEAERLATAAAERAAAVAALDERIAPLEAAVGADRRAAREQAAALDQARRRLQALEGHGGEARVSAARAEDRLERLAEQLQAEAEWLPALAGLAERLAGGEAADGPAVAAASPPAGLDDEISALRRELRAIGAIDHEALAAYEETAAHHRQLAEQRTDLEAAAADLRQLLATLEAEMAARFEVTFGAVAAEFTAFFPALFGGGDAEMVLERAGDGPPGIEILARPPGKRRQPLSLLSGGERALTAVALIFALIKVSQTPFVVLDEVDAALDEANVQRFCAALRTLAGETQIVIVTHNRATIQIAGTVYGITMGDDGASQTISLRVEDALAS
jgi:chromosome segregation protein